MSLFGIIPVKYITTHLSTDVSIWYFTCQISHTKLFTEVCNLVPHMWNTTQTIIHWCLYLVLRLSNVNTELSTNVSDMKPVQCYTQKSSLAIITYRQNHLLMPLLSIILVQHQTQSQLYWFFWVASCLLDTTSRTGPVQHHKELSTDASS